MTYGLGTRAPVESLDARQSSARPWRGLDEAHRIEAIEQALRAANDCADGYPLAL